MTSRLGTGKRLTLFYSVCTVLHVMVVVLLLGLDEEVPGVRVDVALHPLADVHRHWNITT